MEQNLGVAIVTGGFTSLVGIAALRISNKRVDDLRQEIISLRAAIDMLIGTMHDMDKRLSSIEDRMAGKP